MNRLRRISLGAAVLMAPFLCHRPALINMKRFVIPSYNLSLRDTVELSGILIKTGENTSLFDVYDYESDKLFHQARLFIQKNIEESGIYTGKFLIEEKGFSGYMYLAFPIKLERIEVNLELLKRRIKEIKVREGMENVRLLGFVPSDDLIIMKGEGEKIERKGIIFSRNGYYFLFKKNGELLRIIKTREKWVEEK